MSNNDIISRTALKEEIDKLHVFDHPAIGEHLAYESVMSAVDKCPCIYPNDSREDPAEIIRDVLKTMEGMNAALDAQASTELRLHKHVIMNMLTDMEADLQTAMRMINVQREETRWRVPDEL